MAAHGEHCLAPLHSRPVVLDPYRMVVGLLRAVGMVAVPLRNLVPLGQRRVGLGMGKLLGSGMGELGLGSRLGRLVSLGLLLGLVLAPLLPLLRLSPLAQPAWIPESSRGRRRSDASPRRHSEARRGRWQRRG